MRYIINFQVKVVHNKCSTDVVRSSYTILEDEAEKNNLSDFVEVENWFKKLFSQKPLDFFVDTSLFKNNISSSEIKIGRITNSISGKYKTF